MPADEQVSFLNKDSILRVPNFCMPLGLLDISAYVREKVDGINIQILDIGRDLYEIYLKPDNYSKIALEKFIDFELDSVKSRPKIIGISCLFSTSQKTSILIAEAVKKKWRDSIVVFGGNHATNTYKYMLKNSNIDYVVRGEGEVTFLEFVKKIQAKNDGADIFGIFDKEKSNDNTKIELSPMVDNLDEIPLPAYDLLDINFYKETVGASMMFSRGCPFQCTFCASHTVHGRKVRFKTVDRIMEEFRKLINEYNFNKIIIEDDLFAAKKKDFLCIVDKLSNLRDKIEFFLPAGFSVHILDEEIIDALGKLGIYEIRLAVESGSQYVQKNIIKKNVPLLKAKSLAEHLRRREESMGKETFVSASFILGFPDETKELMQETIDFIDCLDVDWVDIFHALPLPGSEIYDQLVSRGVIDQDKFNWDGMRYGKRVFDTPEITAEELEKIIYDANIKCNFFNNKNLKYGRFQKAIDVFTKVILIQYPFHIVGRYCRALGYIKLGDIEIAEIEFKECVRWINTNKESMRLFERYGSDMPFLKGYL